MEAKNFEFANTNNALAELSEALVNLNAAVAAKKNDIKAQKKQGWTRSSRASSCPSWYRMTTRSLMV